MQPITASQFGYFMNPMNGQLVIAPIYSAPLVPVAPSLMPNQLAA